MSHRADSHTVMQGTLMRSNGVKILSRPKKSKYFDKQSTLKKQRPKKTTTTLCSAILEKNLFVEISTLICVGPKTKRQRARSFKLLFSKSTSSSEMRSELRSSGSSFGVQKIVNLLTRALTIKLVQTY